MNTWVIHYEIAAIIIIFAVSILFMVGHRVYTKTSRVFKAILLMGMATAISDELSVFGLSHTDIVSPIANSVLIVLYNVFMMSTVFLYVVYIVLATGTDSVYKKRFYIFGSVPIVLELIFFITSPITHFMFYIDEAGVYHRGVGMPQCFVVVGIYVSFMAYLCFIRSDHISRVQLISTLMYLIAIVVAIILQIVFPELLLNAFAIAIGVMLVFTTMQGEFVDSDKMLDTLNSDAWSRMIARAADTNRPVTLLVVRLGGYERLNTQVGYAGCNKVLRQIAAFLVKLIPGHQVYHLNGLYFGCVLDEKENGIAYAESIEDRLSQNFKIEGYPGNISIPFLITLVQCPGQVKDSQELDALTNMLCVEPDGYEEEKIHVVSDEDIERFAHRKNIEMALERAVRTGGFTVHYQPIVKLDTMKVYSLEALVRLYDDEVGVIYPDEFIPLAEETGIIPMITECVLSRAVSLMSRCRLKEKGIMRMHVNLTASECKRGDRNGKLAAIVDMYDLDRYTICFEISESASPGETNPVGEGVCRLHDGGMGIVLDDFGTGYSNMTEIVALPIDLVKIDKTFLWTAMMDDGAMTVLREFVDMIHKSGRKVLIAGVEDKHGLEVVKELEADYVQGFCFAKPMPQDELIEYINNVNVYGMSPIQEA